MKWLGQVRTILCSTLLSKHSGGGRVDLERRGLQGPLHTESAHLEEVEGS